MDTFFFEGKDVLWNYVRTIHEHPEMFDEFGQAARFNMILYGPGGTGKSTFVYRIAMVLMRHIISLDLRYSTKRELYETLYSCALRKNNNSGFISTNDKKSTFTPKDTVFLFEEFDNCLLEMYIHEKNLNKREQEKREKDISAMDQGVKKSDFRVKDLLELFQGPVPITGSIMVATTNDLDSIKEVCPNLFRAGRMTTIYFGYISKKTLQELVTFYFKRPLEIYVPDKMKIPTSEIIELALETKMLPLDDEEKFRRFEVVLEKKIIDAEIAYDKATEASLQAVVKGRLQNESEQLVVEEKNLRFGEMETISSPQVVFEKDEDVIEDEELE